MLETYIPQPSNDQVSNTIEDEDLERSLATLVTCLFLNEDVYFYNGAHTKLVSRPSVNDNLNTPERILSSQSKLYFKTSGTTGEPKLVCQDMSRLKTFVSMNPQNLGLSWGFCYSTRHISGLMLMLQAILTRSKITDLRNHDADTLINLIEDNQISHMSAPATFYKLNFPLKAQAPCLRLVTNGGEPLTDDTIQRIRQSLPNVDIRNIYASTEFGSLLVSKTEYFRIPARLAETVKIENNTLFVHHSLCGNFDEIESQQWFNTKDKVAWHDSDSFKIIGRESEDVNVLGHLVSLRKVEAALNAINGVTLCKVSPKEHSTFGTLLTALVVLDVGQENLSTQDIKAQAKNTLRNYEVPSKIRIVKEIQLTSSGKLKRLD